MFKAKFRISGKYSGLCSFNKVIHKTCWWQCWIFGRKFSAGHCLEVWLCRSCYLLCCELRTKLSFTGATIFISENVLPQLYLSPKYSILHRVLKRISTFFLFSVLWCYLDLCAPTTCFKGKEANCLSYLHTQIFIYTLFNSFF